MERPSKLADLTLVSKYYPVANYSYPRKDGSRSSSPTHRSSLGSEGSAPGLVDDDSEASFDDDYQYNSHASEIWDTFWQPESFKCEEDVHPKKQYPALLPSPYHRRDHADISSRRGAAWPLPESPCQQSRKPAAAYSPFPKPIALPPRSTSLVPSWTNSRSQEKPQRPPRPDSRIVRSYLTPRSPITSAFAAADISTSRPITRPLTPSEPRPRVISPLEPRPATSCGNRAPSPSCGPANTIILVQPSPGLPSPAFQFPVPPPAQERPLPARPPMLDLSAQELKSFFDHDSDDEEGEPESTPRFKFLFHKRSDSDSKRTTESHPAPPKTRNRAKTAPSSPSGEHPLACEETSKSSSQGKKRQGDYFHRMLGRRSR
ncbi:hypothetical protein NLU13_4141 [Sarocladium strictum]|uniref:Uncharacterized protein n=1 Tax=Sarocladium strictum TaxID=5046 RepID=A0AA39GIY7_SARSR|nr:hypothetical protein NLU13_4141 [Sarocladium strictum]